MSSGVSSLITRAYKVQASLTPYKQQKTTHLHVIRDGVKARSVKAKAKAKTKDLSFKAKTKAKAITSEAKAKGNDMTPKAKAMTSKAKVKINIQIFRSKDNDNMSQFGVVLLLSECSGIFLLIVFSSCVFCKLYIILFNWLDRQSSQSHMAR